eukprot:14512621-Ditylum_brightwellii.AAC.2
MSNPNLTKEIQECSLFSDVWIVLVETAIHGGNARVGKHLCSSVNILFQGGNIFRVDSSLTDF